MQANIVNTFVMGGRTFVSLYGRAGGCQEATFYLLVEASTKFQPQLRHTGAVL